ncbi:replication protein [Paenibacillus hubeiensis]|uniref:replication protein n=1 Tax=Paenibacillus hubeiensis TaxID=3077330 RepID=UPI0031BBC2C9
MAGPGFSEKYTQVANEIIEEVARHKFNGTQLRILLIVWRQTYGWHRKSAELSATYLATALQSDLRGVKKELNHLLDIKVLTVHRPAQGKHGRYIGFNKYTDQWLVGDNRPPQKLESTGGQLSTYQVDDYTPELVDNRPPKKEKKESIKKDNKNNKGAAKEMASKTKLAKSREGKQEYADEVWLKPEEHAKLLNEFGEEGLTWMVDVLSSYKLSVDKFYASDYAVFKKGGWLRMKYEEHLAKMKKGQKQPSFLEKKLGGMIGDGGRIDVTPDNSQASTPKLLG